MQKFKIIAIAKAKKNLVRIGTTKEDAEWFFLSEPVIKYLGGSDKLLGKEIATYEAQWSNTLKGQLISRVTLPNQKTATAKTTESKPEIKKPENKTPVKTVTNTVDNTELIKATAQTINSLIGEVTLNNINETIVKVYNTYKSLK